MRQVSLAAVGVDNQYGRFVFGELQIERFL
jgi:hypothetical protein